MKKPIVTLSALRQVNELNICNDARFEEVICTDIKKPESTGLDVVFETVFLEKVDLSLSVFEGLKLVDTKIVSSDLSNLKSEKIYVLRSEFIGCRLTGLQLPDGILRDTLFQKCKLELSLFRFSTLKDVVFDECILANSDFLGTTLNDVVFKNCDLTDTEFSQAKIKNVDIRGSKIQNIHLQKESVTGGLKVDTGQALYLSGLFGLVIED